MTRESREALKQAYGMIDALGFVVPDGAADALCVSGEIIAGVLESEEKKAVMCFELESKSCCDDTEESIEHELPDGIMNPVDTARLFEKCRLNARGVYVCGDCPLKDDGCREKLDKSAYYHLKRYAGLK